MCYIIDFKLLEDCDDGFCKVFSTFQSIFAPWEKIVVILQNGSTNKPLWKLDKFWQKYIDGKLLVCWIKIWTHQVTQIAVGFCKASKSFSFISWFGIPQTNVFPQDYYFVGVLKYEWRLVYYRNNLNNL